MFFEVPRSFSRRVFDDGHEAIYDRRHPCHHMIRWQDELGIKPYQLPEPFSGRRSEYRLIFVGLNPSLSENEEIPVAADDWDLKRYDDYYRARFDPAHRNGDGRIAVRFSIIVNQKFRNSGEISKILEGNTFQRANRMLLCSANTLSSSKSFTTNQRVVGWETRFLKKHRFWNTSSTSPVRSLMKSRRVFSWQWERLYFGN